MNKKVVLIIIAFFFSVYAFSQQTKALELIWKGKYENASKIIEKGLIKNREDVEFNFYKAYLLFQRGYGDYDLVQSYKCLETCIAYYPKLEDKEKEKLALIPLNIEKFESYLDTVCRLALNDVEKENTFQAYSNYLAFFRKASPEYRKEAQMFRNIEAYKLAIKKDTEEAYASFIQTYPDAQQIKDATKRRNEKAYEKATDENTVSAYEQFIKKYPEATQVTEAQENIYTLALDEAVKENSSAAIKRYMEKYPQSSQYYKAEMLYDEKLYNEETSDGSCYSYYRFAKKYPNSKWYNMAISSALQCAAGNVQIVKFCYNNLDGDKKKQALGLYYDIVASDGELISIKHLYDELPADHQSIIREKYVADSAIAAMGNKLKISNGYNAKKLTAYEEYIKVAAPKEKAFVALQKMIEADIESGNWTKAIATISKYRQYWKDNTKKIDNLIQLLEQQAPVITAEALPGTINTSGNEFNPILSADGHTMYFCGEGRNDSKKGEDIFVAQMTENGWGKAEIVDEISTKANDYPQCLNTSGNVLYILKNGRLYFSKKAGATWGKAQRMSGNVNSCNWQGDAFISADGKALFFAAKRSDMLNIFNDADFGALDYHGKIDEAQTDIYVCTVDENGEWGKPINLGGNVNTMFSERTPFLHSDNKHLYFASDGHGGFGGLDMFVVTRTSDDCWDCWSEPINLGKGINTAKDDSGFKISGNGEKAFFSKSNGKKGNLDIYFINLPEHLQPKNIK